MGDTITVAPDGNLFRPTGTEDGGGAGRGAIKTNREAFSFVFYPLIPFGQAKSRDLLEVHFLDKTKSERINKGKIVVDLGQFSKQFS